MLFGKVLEHQFGLSLQDGARYVLVDASYIWAGNGKKWAVPRSRSGRAR